MVFPFSRHFHNIIKHLKERTATFRQEKLSLKNKHSKKIKYIKLNIKKNNFSIARKEKDNKNKKKLEVEKEKDFQIANVLRDCKNLESKEKLAVLEYAGLERKLLSEYLMNFKQIFLLHRELFSSADVCDNINKLDQILQNDLISIDAVSGILSVSKDVKMNEKEETNSPPVMRPQYLDSWSGSDTDRTSVLSNSSSDLSTLSTRRPPAKLSTVRRSASPMRPPDYVVRPVACTPPVITRTSDIVTSQRTPTALHCQENQENDEEVCFYMENMVI